MHKHVRIVTPIVTEAFRGTDDFSVVAGSDVDVSQVSIKRGPASIECEFDEALAVPDTVARIIEAEQEGVDAVVVDCMSDPGVKAGREVVTIPVLGPAETTMHLASMLGHKFSIVTVLDSVMPGFENRAKIYGVDDKLASVRPVNIPVLELEQDRDRLVELLTGEAVKAVVEDGAHVIIFGCTGMMGCADGVQHGLVERGYSGIPVIDPIPATIKLAENLVDLRLQHSKRTYPVPPQKRIVGHAIPGRDAPLGAASANSR